MHIKSREGVVRSSPHVSGRHILLATLVATAALNALWLISNALSPTPNVVSSPDFTIIADSNVEFMRMKVRIGLALALGAVALCLSKLKSPTVSCVALAWVMTEYIMWWYRSYVLTKSAEAAEYSRVSHLAYLYNATWWDVWVIALTVMLLAYQLKMLLRRRGVYDWRS